MVLWFSRWAKMAWSSRGSYERCWDVGDTAPPPPKGTEVRFDDILGDKRDVFY